MRNPTPRQRMAAAVHTASVLAAPTGRPPTVGAVVDQVRGAYGIDISEQDAQAAIDEITGAPAPGRAAA